MKQQSIFNRSGGFVLLVLAALSAPAMAQQAPAINIPTDPGEQPFGWQRTEPQAPMGREQQPGVDTGVSPDSSEMQTTEPRARGPEGPIREERMRDQTAADRGFEGFLQFQERGTNSP